MSYVKHSMQVEAQANITTDIEKALYFSTEYDTRIR